MPASELQSLPEVPILVDSFETEVGQALDNTPATSKFVTARSVAEEEERGTPVGGCW